MDFTGERYVPAIEGQIKYEHLHRYAVCLDLVAGKSVLDVASGEGYGAALLASAAESVTGVDIDAGSVEHARHLYYKPNLKFVVGSCDRIPLPDQSFDIVTSFETIEHHDKNEEMLDEIKRVLKPVGMLIISSPNRLTYSDEPGYKNPFHVKELYYDEFYDLLLRRFQSIRVFGQRLAAGSFLFPLGTPGGSDLKSLIGDSAAVSRNIRELPSPLYFIALCSDDTRIAELNISSVYLDRVDDLMKTLEQERVRDIRRMQEQVRSTEQTIERQRAAYEAEIAKVNEGLGTQILKLTEELGDTIRQLRHRDAVIAERDQAIVQLDDAIAQFRAHWTVSAKNIREHKGQIRAYEQLLAEAQSQISRHIEVLNWIYASRFWRIGRKTLKQIEQMNERVSGHREVFKGELQQPQSPVSDSLVIRGWVYSKAAPVVLVEAFLDDFYLGSIHYGEEGPNGYGESISLHGFNFAGERILKVRVHDQKGNRQVFTRRVTVVASSQLQVAPPARSEIFQGTLEHPEAGSLVSGRIEVTGWVCSKAAPILFVEGFLGESYLGRVSYGIERPDVLEAFPMEVPLRCGYRKVFSITAATPAGKQTLKLRFYDSQGNIHVVEREISCPEGRARRVEDEPGESQESSQILKHSPGVSRRLSSDGKGELQRVIAQFQQRFGRDPSILDWNSGLDLQTSFPNLPVVSPPSDGDTLPYLDHTIDMVVTASSDPACIVEAKCVASGAVVRFFNSGSPVVEWQLNPEENPPQSVSIIIPVHNKVSYTQKCLDQLLKTDR